MLKEVELENSFMITSNIISHLMSKIIINKINNNNKTIKVYFLLILFNKNILLFNNSIYCMFKKISIMIMTGIISIMFKIMINKSKIMTTIHLKIQTLHFEIIYAINILFCLINYFLFFDI